MTRAADLATLIVDVNTTEAKTDELTGKSTAGSIAVTAEGNTTTTNLQQGLAKSWCRWQSTSGTASVTDSFNHSGIVDNGAGDFTITIASAMANVNYAHAGMAGGGSTNLAAICQPQDATAVTTTVTRYQTVYGNGNLYDWSAINTTLFGDLA